MQQTQDSQLLDLDSCKTLHLAKLPRPLGKDQNPPWTLGSKGYSHYGPSDLTRDSFTVEASVKDQTEGRVGRHWEYSGQGKSSTLSPLVEEIAMNGRLEPNICSGSEERIRDSKQHHHSDNEDNDGDESENSEKSNTSKDSQVSTTLQWLTENYELSEGVCLPRCVLYLHYLDLCKRQGFKPAGAATFGKLIRQKFKNITTRRLGTRGQSKYHYYGIGIKESSIYYQSVYTGKGLTRFSGIKIKTEGSNRKYSLSSKTGTLLPDFPDASNLVLPSRECAEQMKTFLMMYRTHCQRILDTIITANFEEIQNLFLHFWQGYPTHLEEVLKLDITADVIAVCDSILYKVLLDVLLPHSIQDLPEGLCSDVRAFLKALPGWLDNSLEDLVPDGIITVKRTVLRQFIRTMTRHLSFIKMAQTARPQLVALDVTTKALNDLDLLDLQPISAQACFALNERAGLTTSRSVSKVLKELKSLLRAQTPIDGFTEWVDGLVEACVLAGHPSTADCKVQDRLRAITDPPGWGLDTGPTTLSRKQQLTVTETATDIHKTWLVEKESSPVELMTCSDEGHKEACLTTTLLTTKNKTRLGTWNIRTL
ncbi:hypothetical protein EGW08_018016 [Elysia chlorotica]|uniref:DNA-binding protein RFX6 n=1 Tax=Elysia chlorotica TaxID=188477 RepID=A0A433SYH1_ELYCH|nr:hypothetical protein EGW08_018016 [Elysia chlorotica]